ncbi:MAG: hydrogenase expression/formation protein HypE [Spirochaetota bacterium]
MDEYVLLDHGSGGTRTAELVERVFRSRFTCEALRAQTDAAVLPPAEPAGDRIALTTDAHAVKPLFFPGGDIGALAVAGTVNDLAVSGARPLYLTASFIIEEGFPVADLERIADSMAGTARAAGVEIVAGDTKVTERGDCDGLYITTSGLGVVPREREGIAEGRGIRPGDRVLVSAPLAAHGAAILCARNELQTESPVRSDCAPLGKLIESVLAGVGGVRFIRDATRGGAATVLCEIAERRGLDVLLEEEAIPVAEQVRGVCEMFGFDPLYLAGEGVAVMIVAPERAERALSVMRGFREGRDAADIGVVQSAAGAPEVGRVPEAGDGDAPSAGPGQVSRVVIHTAVGGRRLLRRHVGAQVPRIC